MHVIDARATLFEEYADKHFMTVHGQPSQQLPDSLTRHVAAFKWARFVQGLEPPESGI